MATNRHSRSKPKKYNSDAFDAEKIPDAHAFTAFRYLSGQRQVLGPFDTVEEAVQAAAETFAADDTDRMSANDKLRPFAIYAVTKMYGFDHTTHFFNLERNDALQRAGLGDNEASSGSL